MPDLEKIKLLFEVHHKHASEKRQKIHSITERTVNIYLIMIGWLVIVDKPMVPGLRFFLIAGIIVSMITACLTLLTNHKSYLENASVIRNLNDALEVFKTGVYLEGKSLYPERWKNYGQYGRVGGFVGHWSIIIIMAIIAIAAVILHP